MSPCWQQEDGPLWYIGALYEYCDNFAKFRCEHYIMIANITDATLSTETWSPPTSSWTSTVMSEYQTWASPVILGESTNIYFEKNLGYHDHCILPHLNFFCSRVCHNVPLSRVETMSFIDIKTFVLVHCRVQWLEVVMFRVLSAGERWALVKCSVIYHTSM